MNDSNRSLRFSRTLREAGMGDAEWAGKSDGSGWLAAICWGIVGAAVLWIFFVLALSGGGL